MRLQFIFTLGASNLLSETILEGLYVLHSMKEEIKERVGWIDRVAWKHIHYHM